MNILTIPKRLIQNDDWVVLPREFYEALLSRSQNNQITVKRSASFKIKKGQEKFYDKLDKELTQALFEYKTGKATSPFSTAEDAVKFLNSRKKHSK